MTRIPRLQRILICCLCVTLAVVCAFYLLLPHCHSCDHVQCQLCDLISQLKQMQVAVITVCVLCVTKCILVVGDICDIGSRYSSLVLLKVKLSN